MTMSTKHDFEKLRFKWTSETRPQSREQNYGVRDGYEFSPTLVSGAIYWADGRGALYKFSLKDRTWLSLGAPLMRVTERGSSHLAALSEDKIYYCGGTIRQRVVEYDITLGVARSLEGATGNAPYETKGVSVVFACWSSEMICFGGLKPQLNGLLGNAVYSFGISNHWWKRIEMRGQPPQPRTDHSAALLGRNMYIFGGLDQAHNPLHDLWICHLRSRTSSFWSSPFVAGVNISSRSKASLNVIAGKLILFGGHRDDMYMDDLYIFYPETVEWKDTTCREVDVAGVAPVDTDHHQGVATPGGILYFTSPQICLLSQI